MTTNRTAGELMRAYYEALDAAALDRLDQLFAPSFDWRFPGTHLETAAAVRARMTRSLATGLKMDHRIGHMLDNGDVAICELVATNRLPGGEYTVSGSVVCEARDGRITRFVAYPNGEQLGVFAAALAERARELRPEQG